MLNYSAGNSWSTQWATLDSTGAAVAADATPTVKIYRNGTDDSANWALGAVSATETGIYRVTGTVYASATAGDLIEVVVAATVGGIAAKAVVERFRLVQWPVTALPNAASGAAGAVITSGTGTAQLAVSGGKVDLTSTGLDAVLVESGIVASASLVNDSGTQLTTINFRQLMALLGAAESGKLTISGSNVVIRNAGDTKNRINATSNASDERVAVNLIVPD
jgi:hypothetical protein